MSEIESHWNEDRQLYEIMMNDRIVAETSCTSAMCRILSLHTEYRATRDLSHRLFRQFSDICVAYRPEDKTDD